jgi:hypothetical protein
MSRYEAGELARGAVPEKIVSTAMTENAAPGSIVMALFSECMQRCRKKRD